MATIVLIVGGLSRTGREFATESFALQKIALGVLAHNGGVAGTDAVNQGDIADLGLVIDVARTHLVEAKDIDDARFKAD